MLFRYIKLKLKYYNNTKKVDVTQETGITMKKTSKQIALPVM